jgi:hypothetical protein
MPLCFINFEDIPSSPIKIIGLLSAALVYCMYRLWQLNSSSAETSKNTSASIEAKLDKQLNAFDSSTKNISDDIAANYKALDRLAQAVQKNIEAQTNIIILINEIKTQISALKSGLESQINAINLSLTTFISGRGKR